MLAIVGVLFNSSTCLADSEACGCAAADADAVAASVFTASVDCASLGLVAVGVVIVFKKLSANDFAVKSFVGLGKKFAHDFGSAGG